MKSYCNKLREVHAMYELIKKDVLVILDDENDYTIDHHDDINHIKNTIRNFEVLFITFIINTHYKISREVNKESCEDKNKEEVLKIIQEEISNNKWFASVEEIIEKAQEIEKENFHIKPQFISKFVNGTKLICTPAVFCALNSFYKIVKMIDVNLKYLSQYPEETNFKMVFILSSYLSKLFDFFYAASLDNEEDILYKPENTSNLNHLLSVYDFSEPKDLKTHKESIIKGCSEIDYYVALAAKAFKSSYFFDQVSDLLSWALYYKDKKYEYTSDGEFAKILLNKESLHRLMNITNSSYLLKKIIEIIKSHPLPVNYNILIPNSLADELDIKSLDENSTPMMIDEDLRMQFKMAYDDYDQEEFIKANIVCEADWDRVNWSTGELINSDASLKYFDAIYLHFHGGGFIFGSSFESQPWTIKITKEKKCPVFSIDYRLAPKYKFPAGISDSWIFYLWIIKYAKKYLRIDFDKIILTGDSAGGNIILGITNLAIQRGVRVPDGLMLIYPALMVGKTHFSPSALYSLDDTFLNANLLYLCIDFYVTQEMLEEDHYILSPMLTPDSILEKYPKIRFIVAGLDPLRDEQIRFILRLAKLGVNVKATEFRYLMHTCIGHDKPPFDLKEARKMHRKAMKYLDLE